MKSRIFLFILTMVNVTAIAQTFEQFYGTPNTSEIAFGGIETESGDILMLNRVNNPNTGTYDMQLMLLDSFGEQIWEKNYETPENEEELDILQLVSGGYLLTSKSQDVNVHPVITKINVEGEVIWRNSSLLQNRKLIDTTIGNNGEIVCLVKDQVYHVMAINENQEIIWQTPIEDSQTSILEINSISSTQNGDYLLSGGASPNNADEQLMLLYKMNQQGDKEWLRLLGQEDISSNPVSEYAIETSDGGYFVLGRTNSGGIFRIVYKTDSEGFVIWKDSGVSASLIGAYGAIEGSGGSLTTLIGENSELSNYSKEGELEWRKFFYKALQVSLYGMIPTAGTGGLAYGTISGVNGSGSDAYLIRYDAEGDTVWTKNYGEFGNRDGDEARAIAHTSNNELLIFGLTQDTPLRDSHWVLSAVDADNGTPIWKKQFGDETITGLSILPIEENTFLLSGLVVINNQLTTRLLKIDAQGEALWQKDYPNTFPDKTPTIVQTAEKDFVGLVNALQNYRLIKTSKEGETLWQRELDAGDFYNSITALSDGSFVLTGAGKGQSGENGFYTPMIVVKFDSEGILQWKKTIVDESPDFSSGVAFQAVENETGSIVIVGVNFFGGKGKVTLLALDKFANDLWKQELTDFIEINLSVFDLLETQTGELLVMGNTPENENSISNFQKGFLIKADAEGNHLWTQYYGDDISTNTILSDIIEMPDGGIAVIGNTLYKNSRDNYLFRTDENGLITSINPQQNLSFYFNILPNPNQGLFELGIEGETKDLLKMIIFDSMGKRFLEQKIHPLSQKIDLSHLPKGIYFLQLSDGLQFGIKRLLVE